VFGTIPQPTAFDLHWRMFGIDVRVHPFFWLMAVMLGWDTVDWGLQYLLLWVVFVFISVLIHELGHVVMGRIFGAHGHILLYAFGGLAIGSSSLPHRWQRILVLLAGPLTELILVGILLIVLMMALPHAVTLNLDVRELSLVGHVLRMLFYFNVFWALLNLVPIFPLDGGQISREIFEGTMGQRGIVISLALSLAVAGVLAVQALAASYGKSFIPFLPFIKGLYMAIFFALFAATSFQLLQAELARGRWRDEERLPWE
jgi:Zn-dependent protease